MRVSRFVPRLGSRTARAVVTRAFPVLALIASNAFAGQRAVVDPDGSLYELLRTHLPEVDFSAAGTPREHDAVLALRTTTPAGLLRLEVVGGSQEAGGCGAFSLERDAATATLLVACTNVREPNAGLRLAVHRDGAWTWREIASGSGPAVARNPKAVVTRQRYVVSDGNGKATEKSRTIFHVVWWEEGSSSRARYLPVFVEETSRPLDGLTAWSLDELAGAATPADAPGAPFGAVAFPGIHAEPEANGGVLVTFADLASRRQRVVRIHFLDDFVTVPPSGGPASPDEPFWRSHSPVGRSAGAGRLPVGIPQSAEVETRVSPEGVTTFFWFEGGGLRFVRSDDGEGAPARRVDLRPDLSEERASILLERLADKR